MKRLLPILAAAVLLSACCPSGGAGIPANKKAIMDAFVAGTLDPSYVPAAFFAHFPGPKEGEGAVRSHLDFYLRGNADILKVQFEQFAPAIADYGTQEGWDAVAPLPEDFYRQTLEVVSGIQAIAGRDVYVLPTIYSPYQVALQALGEKGIREAATRFPEEFIRVLGYYADALKWLVRECKAAGIEGFYMTCQGGEMKYYDIPEFYARFVRPSDLEVMSFCTEGTRMNILHICDWEGTYDDLTRYADYPGQIVNTPIDLNGTHFGLWDAVELFGGRPVLGGLERKGIILSGSAEEVAAAAAKAIEEGAAGKAAGSRGAAARGGSGSKAGSAGGSRAGSATAGAKAGSGSKAAGSAGGSRAKGGSGSKAAGSAGGSRAKAGSGSKAAGAAGGSRAKAGSGSKAAGAAGGFRAGAAAAGGKMMLGAECTVSDAPMENIHAAIATAHNGGKMAL